MRLYIYRGIDGEKVPKDVTHVIVDENVTIIKKMAFINCWYLVSIIMSNNVKRIEQEACSYCIALRFIRLSKTLEFIGMRAFIECRSMEALFLPSSVKTIQFYTFMSCDSLRLLVLPNTLSNTTIKIIGSTVIYQIAATAGVEYEWDRHHYLSTRESIRRVNEWLIHHMDEWPFHKFCYNPSVTTHDINNFLNENGNDFVHQIDEIHGMTPLHMLAMNPHAPADATAALLDVDMEVAFQLDNEGSTSLDYARDFNVGGLVAMINGLSNHRHAV